MEFTEANDLRIAQRDKTKADFLERFAACWRAIGQPKTDGLFVLVAIDTEEFDAIERTVLGMPVIEIDHPLGQNNVAIGAGFDRWSDVPSKFAIEWIKSEQPY